MFSCKMLLTLEYNIYIYTYAHLEEETMDSCSYITIPTILLCGVPLCLGALGGAIKVHLDEGITAGTHHTSAIGLPWFTQWGYLNHHLGGYEWN